MSNEEYKKIVKNLSEENAKLKKENDQLLKGDRIKTMSISQLFTVIWKERKEDLERILNIDWRAILGNIIAKALKYETELKKGDL